MKTFLKKWWSPLAGLAALLTFVGYIAFVDVPRMQERQEAILEWAMKECVMVPFEHEGKTYVGFRCSHVMKPAKGGLIYIEAVSSNGGVWAWQERPHRKPKALWTVPAECLSSPDTYVGPQFCSTLRAEPDKFKSTIRGLFNR